MELTFAISLGFWPAVPVAGYVASSWASLHDASRSRVASFGLYSALGIALWSPVLLLSVVSRLYSPEIIGGLGWGLIVLFALRFVRHFRAGQSRAPDRSKQSRWPIGPWDAILGAGLLAAAILYLGFPGEFIIGGRDENSYTLHGLWISEYRRLDIPYPWPAALHETFYDAFLRFSGTFRTEPTMTPAFGHVLPTWLGQADATFGYAGLLRLNAVFSLVGVTVFYGACRLIMAKQLAVVAAIVLAVNPAQIWVSRTTLTEILTQLLLWAGLWLLINSFRAKHPHSARWAGGVLSVAILVRIDVIVVIPLLVLAHLGMRIVESGDYRSDAMWRAFYQAAIPGVALAASYYLLFSRPYVTELRPQLYQVAAITVISLVLLAVGSRARIRPIATRITTSATFLIILACVIAGATSYAYFVRPGQEPFDTFGPAQVMVAGRRTYAEDALPNLAAYLSLFVVFGGVLGWYTAYRRATLAKRGMLMPLLLVGGGVSVMYLINPAVTPDHFWAVRRFVPAVVPAFIAFTMLGAWHVMFRWRAWSGFFCAGLLVLFAVFSAKAFAPFVFFSEHNGYRSQLAVLAAELPEDRLVLALDGERWWKPLYMAFGRPVATLSLASTPGRAAFTTWVAAELKADRQPLVLTVEPELHIPGLRHERVAVHTLRRLQHRGTATPLPSEVSDENTRISLFRILGEDASYTFRDNNLIDGLIWGLTRVGLYDRELHQGTAVTWTNGSAKITVPLRELRPSAMSISVADVADPIAPLQLLVNNEEVYNGAVSPGWEATFQLPSLQESDSLTIELLSGSEVEERDVAVEGSLYRQETMHRTVGIAIHALRLMGSSDE